MKRSFLILLLVSFIASNAGFTFAQSCCTRSSGNDMKSLALNKSFKAAHEAPVPFEYTPGKGGALITFQIAGGADGNAFYVSADESTDKILIVVHEWWGLNDYIKREAERWQKLLGGKVAVYAVDLYDGKVASSPDEAGKLMGRLDAKRGEAILKGLIQKLGAGKSIASIGWCMGGSWSFNATLAASSQAAGCVMYYGFPEKDTKRIKILKADVLYNYGARDNFIKESDVKQFGKEVVATGHKFTFHSFDAVHAFANPSNPKYDSKSADEAQVYTLKFLKEKLGVE